MLTGQACRKQASLSANFQLRLGHIANMKLGGSIFDENGID